ncbi:MAG: hypothetical protein ACREP1_02610 [Rhodanobacteraceae bacterium]
MNFTHEDPRAGDAAALEPFELSPRDAEFFCAQPFHWVGVAIGGGAACGFSDEEAAALFAARYRHLPCERASRRFYCGRDGAGSTVFWSEDNAAFRWNRGTPSPGTIAFLADAVVTTLCFGSDAQTVTFHAAALAARDGAFALVGTSGSGKSTTAIAAALAGYGLYSDEFCRTSPAGVEAFPRSLNLRPGGLELLARSAFAGRVMRARFRARAANGWPNAGYDDVLGSARPPDRKPLRHIFRIAGRGARPAMVPTTRYDLLRHIAPYARTAAVSAGRAAELLGALAFARCYELTLGDPDATVRAIAAIVGPARP